MRAERSDRGFTLIEVVISLVLLSTVMAGTGVLFTAATVSTRAARLQTWTTLLAIDKLEELRGRTFGGPGLMPSTVDSLARDRAGYVDYLDQFGDPVGDGQMSPRAVYIRRWSVRPLAADPLNTLILQALVTPVASRLAPGDGGPARVPGDALVTTVRTRTAE